MARQGSGLNQALPGHKHATVIVKEERCAAQALQYLCVLLGGVHQTKLDEALTAGAAQMELHSE